MNLETVTKVGMAAAGSGAEVLRGQFGKILNIQKKNITDLVTNADIESEKAIIQTIRDQYPEHAILAEESGAQKGENDCQWIIDPLDGTTNFAHGVGIFSISIAFSFKQEIVAAIVLNPESRELFSATKGSGAMLNGNPIRVSDSKIVQDSLLVTGFPYDVQPVFPELMTRFSHCLKAARGIRRLGSAALDLCFVACGRFDGYWEENLKPWDTAAGLLIATEAGARVTDFSDRAYKIDDNEILATNRQIHGEMIALLAIEGKI
ncbi:MAG: inositol monophosphatase [Deltaproteobacteria bacterium]|nr:inositol monophosphatase [Deltaproteobacteria bacterium]